MIGSSDGNFYKDEFDLALGIPSTKDSVPSRSKEQMENYRDENEMLSPEPPKAIPGQRAPGYDHDVRIAGFWDFITGAKSEMPEEPKGKEYKATENPPFPSNEDAEFARKQGFAYGQPWENFFDNSSARVLGYFKSKLPYKGGPRGSFKAQSGEGASTADITHQASEVLDLNLPERREIKEKLKDVFARAALAVNRDPIAQLGFSPSDTMIDTLLGQGSDIPNVGGIFDPETNRIYANLWGRNQGADTIVHESMHRGFKALRERSPEAAELMKKLPAEENMVRYMMYQYMGDPESSNTGSVGEAQIKHAKWLFDTKDSIATSFHKENRDNLEKLRNIAAQEIAKKHPGGPR